MFATLEWASTILDGDWLGRATFHPYFVWMQNLAPLETWYQWWGGQAIFHQAPLYPYWVAALLACLGDSMRKILLVQLVVGALDSLVIYALASRLFNPKVGLLAAAMTACYGPYIFQQGTLLRDWLPPLLEPLALLLILRAGDSGRTRNWVLAGATIGVALLAKENLLIFLPLALWLTREYRCTFREAARVTVAIVLGLTITLSPLIVRNALTGAPLLSISNRVAEGFIEGNAPGTNPIGFNTPASLPEILDRANGRLMVVGYETLRLYQVDWLAYPELLIKKLRGLADPIEIPNNLNFAYGLEISSILNYTLTYGVVFPLGLAGLVLSYKNPPRSRLLLFYGLLTLLSLLLGIVLGRYRLVLVPVLIIYGAAALAMLANAISQSKLPTAIAGSALIAGCAVLQHVILPLPTVRTDPGIMVYWPEYLFSASLYGSQKQYEQAVMEVMRLHAKSTDGGSLPSMPASMVSMTFRIEGENRLGWANQLAERHKLEAAREQVQLARAAFVEHFRLEQGIDIREAELPALQSESQESSFFSMLLASGTQSAETEHAIRQLRTWLK
jgi:hypothetical protein